MPQSPTKADPVEIVREFRGLNDQQDSVKRPPGTVTEQKNLFDYQSGDADRRAGREFDSLGDGPINLIAYLTWPDGFITPIIQTGSNLNYTTTMFNFDYGGGAYFPDPFPDPDPFPYPNPFPYPDEPKGEGDGEKYGSQAWKTVLILLEPMMRSLNERNLRVGRTPFPWPNRRVDDAGMGTNEPPPTESAHDYWNPFPPSALVSMPPNNFYKNDIGRYGIGAAISLVNLIIGKIFSSVSGFGLAFVVDPEGLDYPYFYTYTAGPYSVWGPGNSAPTVTKASLYTSILACRDAIRRISSVAVPSQSYVDSRDTNFVEAYPCDAAKNAAIAAYQTTPSVSGVGTLLVNASTGVGIVPPNLKAALVRNKGYWQANLTNYNGTAKLYVRLFDSSIITPSNGPIVTPDNLLHFLTSMATGAMASTVLFGDGPTPSFGGGATCSPSSLEGWQVNSYHVIVTPQITNNV